MNRIPFYKEKFDYLIQHYKTCNGIPFYEEIHFGLIRLKHPMFKGMKDWDIMEYLRPELHHRMPDTKHNCKKYPLFIHSLLNLIPLHKGFHMNNKFWKCIIFAEANNIENFLIRHPRISKFVNEINIK